MARRNGLLLPAPMLTLGFCCTGERTPVFLRTREGKMNAAEDVRICLLCSIYTCFSFSFVNSRPIELTVRGHSSTSNPHLVL